MAALYDTIGRGYAAVRKPDPRIAEAIARGLGDAHSVVNVGAGTGAYEPSDRPVVAVEPSTTMIAQRTAGSAPVVRATAMSLPFKNDSFDAALAVLTVHHWPDKPLGLAELRRVARRRVVVLTWDSASPPFWLTDYFPELLHVDRPLFPTVRDFERALGPVSVATIPVPHDCSDGFLGAHWRRPAQPTSMPVCAARSRRSPSCAAWSPDWSSYVLTSLPAHGTTITASCWTRLSSTSATD